jgi:hypothetical protein
VKVSEQLPPGAPASPERPAIDPVTAAPAAAVPRVGFVSLGCPKAQVDSEHILTQLMAEGYAISSTYEGSDLVVVNTCGFIDAAVQESLDSRSPARMRATR